MNILCHLLQISDQKLICDWLSKTDQKLTCSAVELETDATFSAVINSQVVQMNTVLYAVDLPFVLYLLVCTLQDTEHVILIVMFLLNKILFEYFANLQPVICCN